MFQAIAVIQVCEAGAKPEPKDEFTVIAALNITDYPVTTRLTGDDIGGIMAAGINVLIVPFDFKP